MLRFDDLRSDGWIIMKKFIKGILLVSMALMLSFLYKANVKAAGEKTIANGVFIGDIDVSGMTASEATNSVNDYIQSLSEKTLTLTGTNDETLTITFADLGLGWANTDVVSEAVGLGKEGSIVERYKALKDLQYANHKYEIEYSFDDELINQVLTENCVSFNIEKVNYSLVKSGNTFTVANGQVGYQINVDESISAIKNYIQNEWNHSDATIALVIDEDQPLGSAEELSQVTDVLGQYTTSYSTSGTARSANISNGCSLINGTTLYPGEEFSVLDTITPFTEANGYYPAGSYLNGVVVESIGGGICQVSTTLYNAVLLSELEVTERYNHSMIINYVDPSMDAAIAENGGKNFKFINNTDYPIYIEGYTQNKQITFVIYGKETRDSNRKVSYESEVLETTQPSADQINADASQAFGTITTQAAHIGYKAQLWKIVTVNGVEESREVINSSTYKMVPKIITVGTATGDVEAQTALNTAIATGDINQVNSVIAAYTARAAAAQSGDAQSYEEAAAAAAAAAQSASDQLAAQQGTTATTDGTTDTTTETTPDTSASETQADTTTENTETQADPETTVTEQVGQ